jgi:hypothetical protein
MDPRDRSRLVNLTQLMVRAPEGVPKLVEHIRSTAPPQDFAAAINALEEGYRAHQGSFDWVAAQRLAAKLKSDPDEHRREAGWTLEDSLVILSRRTA